MTTMNKFINIHPSLGEILSDCFQDLYHTHISPEKCRTLSYLMTSLRTFKGQIYISFIQYKILSTMFLLIYTHFY